MIVLRMGEVSSFWLFKAELLLYVSEVLVKLSCPDPASFVSSCFSPTLKLIESGTSSFLTSARDSLSGAWWRWLWWWWWCSFSFFWLWWLLSSWLFVLSCLRQQFPEWWWWPRWSWDSPWPWWWWPPWSWEWWSKKITGSKNLHLILKDPNESKFLSATSFFFDHFSIDLFFGRQQTLLRFNPFFYRNAQNGAFVATNCTILSEFSRIVILLPFSLPEFFPQKHQKFSMSENQHLAIPIFTYNNFFTQWRRET